MRRRLVALSSVAAALSSPIAAAADDPLQLRARDVRAAIPSAEAYFADHGTYAGMTLTKLRRAYDRSLRRVSVGRATKRTYCIQSTLAPSVHYDGPAGPMRKGRCGVRGAEVPRPGSSSGSPTTPEQRIRYATPAIEAYAADHGGSYAGMTLEALQKWDSSITDLRVVWATPTRYCVESGSGGDTYHRVGPAESPASGPCPAAP